jgi:hypothetical protein
MKILVIAGTHQEYMDWKLKNNRPRDDRESQFVNHVSHLRLSEPYEAEILLLGDHKRNPAASEIPSLKERGFTIHQP